MSFLSPDIWMRTPHSKHHNEFNMNKSRHAGLLVLITSRMSGNVFVGASDSHLALKILKKLTS